MTVFAHTFIDAQIAHIGLVIVYPQISQVLAKFAERDIVSGSDKHQPVVTLKGLDHSVIAAGKGSIDISDHRCARGKEYRQGQIADLLTGCGVQDVEIENDTANRESAVR